MLQDRLMKLWKVRPRPDWLDVGDCPEKASALFSTQELAYKVGVYMWGQHFDVEEIDVEESLLVMNTNE